MVENSMKKIGIITYSVMGLIAIILGSVDLVVRSWFDAALGFSWGLLFVFLGFKEGVELKKTSKPIRSIHFVLLIIVIVATLSKLIYRLTTI